MQPNNLFLDRLRITALVGLALLWLLPIIYYTRLPAELPIHFDGSGKPSNWMDKHYVFMLPVMGLFIYLGFRLILRQSSPARISWWSTVSNEQQLQLGKEMSSVLLVIALFSFLYLTWAAIQTGLGNQDGMLGEFIPIFWFFLGGAMIYYIIMHVRAGRKTK